MTNESYQPHPKAPVYQTKFRKLNGSVREIKFIHKKDMNKEALQDHVKGVRERNLQEGFETVWDVEENAFRTINHNTRFTNLDYVGDAEYVSGQYNMFVDEA